MGNKENIILIKAKVYIDSMPDKVYSGFIEKGKDWNGWAKPWFTKEVAKQILKDFEYDWEYDEEQDCFKYKWPDDDVDDDVAFGQDEMVNWTLEHLYPIGNGAWIWLELENAK